MSNMLSEGGRKEEDENHQIAMSALEGGARSSTRKERWFGEDLNPYLVLKTGMRSWLEAVLAQTARTGTATQSLTSNRRLSRGNSEEGKVESGGGLDDELVENRP